MHSSRCWRRGSVVQRRCGMAACILTLIGFASGCGGTRVLLPESGVVRAGPDVRGRVYQWTGTEWELSRNRVQVPEGWWMGAVE